MASRNKIILGTMEFGRRALVERPKCQEMMSKFIDRGYSEVDTAIMYCGGESERILGDLPICRDATKVFLATKANPWGSNSLKFESVMSQASTSLESLQVPSIDLFYLHAPDHNTPIIETLRAVDELHKAGKFKRFGLSNYSAWQVSEIYCLCKQNNWVLPSVYQGMYNGICRMVEGELFPCLRNFGIAFYAYNPLAAGILTGKFKYEDLTSNPAEQDGRFFVESTFKKVYQDRFWRKPVFDAVDKINKALNDAYGPDQVSLVSAAFRWLNHHSALSPEHGDGIIVGVSSMQHLTANLDACDEGPLKQGVVDAFDQAWMLDKANCACYYR